MLTGFQKYYTGILSRKFEVKWLLKIQSQLKRVPTLNFIAALNTNIYMEIE